MEAFKRPRIELIALISDHSTSKMIKTLTLLLTLAFLKANAESKTGQEVTLERFLNASH